MKPGLELSIGQHLTMTPQLQQAIKLLQLSALELDQEIKEALESNPMLETPEETQVETAWNDAYLPTIVRPTSATPTGDNSNSFENYTAKPDTLQDYLMWQMNLSPFLERERIVALAIIDSINDDGYLETNIEDIIVTVQNNPDLADISAEEVSADEVLVVLRRIQQFDPLGVGSRDLQECLLVQLNTLPADTPYIAECKKLLTQHMTLLGQKNYSRIKTRLKLSDEQLADIIKTLRKLHPRPGVLYSPHNAEYIVPDVYVNKKNDTWHVELNKELTTNVRINPNYASLVKRADNSKDNIFLKDHLNEAKWFLKSLHNRHETLLKVATSIVKAQTEFLEKGEEHMQPMVLQDVAAETGLHESTVSRITSKKYIHTPRGVYELKFFFSSHIVNASGEECSSTAIKAMIKKLIQQEQHNKPLSDHEIAKILTEKDFKIARRTVAKYREAMAIPPSNQRKSLV